MGPDAVWLPTLSKGRIWTQKHTQGEDHVEMEAEMMVMVLQAKECQRVPANHQKPGPKRGADPPSQFPEGTNPANTWSLTSGPQNHWTIDLSSCL